MNAPTENPLQAADSRFDPSREVRAPRGAQSSCKSWLTEAAYRMIQNNLDPDVAEIQSIWLSMEASDAQRAIGSASTRFSKH